MRLRTRPRGRPLCSWYDVTVPLMTSTEQQAQAPYEYEPATTVPSRSIHTTAARPLPLQSLAAPSVPAVASPTPAARAPCYRVAHCAALRGRRRRAALRALRGAANSARKVRACVRGCTLGLTSTRRCAWARAHPRQRSHEELPSSAPRPPPHPVPATWRGAGAGQRRFRRRLRRRHRLGLATVMMAAADGRGGGWGAAFFSSSTATSCVLSASSTALPGLTLRSRVS